MGRELLHRGWMKWYSEPTIPTAPSFFETICVDSGTPNNVNNNVDYI